MDAKRIFALTAALLALSLPAAPAYGEGSVNINVGPGGATRHSLGGANPGGGLRSRLQVYVQGGETVYMASSLMNLGAANILVYAPGVDPATGTPLFDCAAVQPGAGRIDTRAEELAGPLPNIGGYGACVLPILTSGIYTVIIEGANSDNGVGGTVDAPVTAITQGRNASMWDVTVRSGLGVEQPGRLFSREIQFRTTGVEGEASDYQSFVYTRTGFEYQVNFFAHSGVNWILGPDDLGVVDAATGERIFRSFACGEESDPNINRPCIHFEAELGPPDRRFPVFFNRVDPIAISGAGGLAETLGYSTTPIAPSTNPVSQPTFTGSAGEPQATSQGTGGTVDFTTPEAMEGLSYSFAVDIDGNGTFGDNADFVDAAEELAASGSNSYLWSGLDAGGTAPPCGTYDYEIRTTLSEVHFAQEDAENSGGMRIERLSLPADPDLGHPLAASYDNVDTFKSPPFVVTNGAPSAVTDGISGPGFNSWSANTGNTDRIDTWTRLPELVEAGSLQILCPDPAVVKSAPATVAPGGQVTWTLNVTNNGPGASSSATVTDTIPPGVTNVASATPGCSVAANTVTCAVGALAAGASTTITITGTAPPAASTCFTNGATVSGDPGQTDANPANNTSTASTCTTPPPPGPANVTIVKSVSDSRVRVGETVTYRLVVRNEGPGVPTDVRVSDDVPGRLDVLSASSSQGECTVSGNRIGCALGTLTVGQEVTVTLRARAIRAGGATNTATVTSERCPANPCDEDPARVTIVEPRLRLTKDVGRRVLRAGDTTSYTIRVSNPSQVALRNVRTCDRLPAGLVYVGARPQARLSGGRHCWTVRRLAGGAGRTYRVTVRALPGASGRLVNTATATSPDARGARANRAVRVIAGDVAAGGVTG